MGQRSFAPIGAKFNRVTIIKDAGPGARGQRMVECRCDCGNVFSTALFRLKSGNTKSCGCARNVRATRGGRSHTPEFTAWASMIHRCYNPKIPNFNFYGARGVKVCDRWRESFDAFLEDMGHRPTRHHSLDRIDPRGDYAPDNCRWATRDMQANNKKLTKHIEAFGHRKGCAQWARALRVEYSLMYSRANRLPAEEAVLLCLAGRPDLKEFVFRLMV